MTQTTSNRSVQAVPRTRSAVCGALTALAGLAVFLLLPAPARADETADYRAQVYVGAGLCVDGEAQLIQRTNDPDYPASLYPTSTITTYSICTPTGYSMRTMPTGWMALHPQLLLWNGTGWNMCHDFGWSYNSDPVVQNSVEAEGLGLEPCGPGYYGLYIAVYAWDGATWRGGWVFSGGLYS